MPVWNEVKTQADIEDLMRQYGGFHDSCLVSLSYQTGESVDPEGAMGFGGPEDHVLSMLFHSQWEPRPLLLRFTGVRRFSAGGWQDRYSSDIFECSLNIYTDLITGRDAPLIVWTDNPGFSPKTPDPRRVLDEPYTTWVIASALQWRWHPQEKAEPPTPQL